MIPSNPSPHSSFVNLERADQKETNQPHQIPKIKKISNSYSTPCMIIGGVIAGVAAVVLTGLLLGAVVAISTTFVLPLTLTVLGVGLSLFAAGAALKIASKCCDSKKESPQEPALNLHQQDTTSTETAVANPDEIIIPPDSQSILSSDSDNSDAGNTDGNDNLDEAAKAESDTSVVDNTDSASNASDELVAPADNDTSIFDNADSVSHASDELVAPADINPGEVDPTKNITDAQMNEAIDEINHALIEDDDVEADSDAELTGDSDTESDDELEIRFPVSPQSPASAVQYVAPDNIDMLSQYNEWDFHGIFGARAHSPINRRAIRESIINAPLPIPALDPEPNPEPRLPVRRPSAEQAAPPRIIFQGSMEDALKSLMLQNENQETGILSRALNRMDSVLFCDDEMSQDDEILQELGSMLNTYQTNYTQQIINSASFLQQYTNQLRIALDFRLKMEIRNKYKIEGEVTDSIFPFTDFVEKTLLDSYLANCKTVRTLEEHFEQVMGLINLANSEQNSEYDDVLLDGFTLKNTFLCLNRHMPTRYAIKALDLNQPFTEDTVKLKLKELSDKYDPNKNKSPDATSMLMRALITCHGLLRAHNFNPDSDS